MNDTTVDKFVQEVTFQLRRFGCWLTYKPATERPAPLVKTGRVITRHGDVLRVYVDHKLIFSGPAAEIEIEGKLNGLTSEPSVQVYGNVTGGITSNGDVSVTGDIAGRSIKKAEKKVESGNWSYVALNSSGQEVKGTIQAEDRDQAIAKIRQRGQIPIKLRAKA